MVVPYIYGGANSFSRDLYDGFSEDLASVEQNGKYGYINTQEKVVIPCVYDWAGSFSKGFAMVAQNGKCCIINAAGKVIVAECDSRYTRWSKVEF